MAAQILPIFQSHFHQYPSSNNPDIFTSMTAFTGVHDEAYPSFQPGLQNQQIYIASSPRQNARELSRRSSTISSNAHSRSSPGRDRTPIRRNPPNVSRPHSQTRAELMAYAADQGRMQSAQPVQPSMTVVPSRSAPTTPQILNSQSTYSLQSGTESYDTSRNFFSSTGSPQIPSSDFNYQSEAGFPDYYQMNPAVSHTSLPRGNLETQQPMYVSLGQQAPPLLPSTLTPADPFQPIPGHLESSGSDLEVASSRRKPQCWEHGCNGRQFSTFSNLLRHQREKSGSAMKAVCPDCGMQFTRTTARNGHINGGKCKGRADNESKATSITGSPKNREEQ